MKTGNFESEEVQSALAILKSAFEQDDFDEYVTSSGYWDLVKDIKKQRGEAIALGKSCLEDAVPYVRFFGISLLGEICNPIEQGQENDAKNIAISLLARAASETSALCKCEMAEALSRTKSNEAIPILLNYSKSHNDDLRLSATIALGSAGDGEELAEVTKRLIELSQDEADDIRDWATMWVGNREDSPAVRLALLDRLNDDHADTADEAVYALAERKDKRALPYLKYRLEGDETSPKDIEAAGAFGLPELLPYLDSWSCYGFLYEWACKRCDPDTKIRDSVDVEWLGEEWYLNVQHGVRRPLKFKEGDHL